MGGRECWLLGFGYPERERGVWVSSVGVSRRECSVCIFYLPLRANIPLSFSRFWYLHLMAHDDVTGFEVEAVGSFCDRSRPFHA